MPRGTVLLLALSALAGAAACSRMPTAPSLANGAPNLPDTLLAKPGPPTVTTLNAQLVTSGSSDGQGPGTEVASGSHALTGTRSGSVLGGDYVASLSGAFSLTISDLYSLPGVDTNYSCDDPDVAPVVAPFIGSPLSGNVTVSADQTAKLSGVNAGKVAVELSGLGGALDGWTVNLHSPSSGGAVFQEANGVVTVTPYFGGDRGTAPSGAIRISKPATDRHSGDGVSLVCRGDFILTLTQP